jgi:hypothetical protein
MRMKRILAWVAAVSMLAAYGDLAIDAPEGAPRYKVVADWP